MVRELAYKSNSENSEAEVPYHPECPRVGKASAAPGSEDDKEKLNYVADASQ
jgi:hypothetical protein